MGRPRNEFACLAGMLPPAREYWREINRRERQAESEQRAAQKARDRKRAKCRCQAYPWPHRPGGGLCRYPDPPVERWKRKSYRPYHARHVGLRRQICRANGLNPIRDRQLIDDLMPEVMELAKRLKQRHPRVKYRNMEIVDKGNGCYGGGKSVSARAMTEAVMESTKQSREPDPDEAASASTDDVFHRLLEQAKPAEQAKLNAMTPQQRRALVAMAENDPERHGFDQSPHVRGKR